LYIYTSSHSFRAGASESAQQIKSNQLLKTTKENPMHINKILHCMSQMEPGYRNVIPEAMSHFIQEIMDFESFSDEGPEELELHEILDEIQNRLSPDITMQLRNCVLEFCITNEYFLGGEPWNCIDHMLKNHNDLFTPKDKKYLKALNASHMSLYKISSVQSGVSLVLQDMVEKSERITVPIPIHYMSQFLQRGQIIAARLLSTKSKTKPTDYSLSDSLLIVPERIAKEVAKKIKDMIKLMNNMALISFLPEIEDTPHNRLLQKKMWAKEILEGWYLYNANYLDYHELFDYDGNPWQPCSLEFKLNAEPKKLVSIFDDMDYWTEGDKPNTWDWLDENGFKDYSALAKGKELEPRDKAKTPLFAGSVMKNFTTDLCHKVLGEVTLKKDKLIIDVSSTQMANIAQDFIETHLGQMVDKPTITKKDVNDPRVHHMGGL